MERDSMIEFYFRLWMSYKYILKIYGITRTHFLATNKQDIERQVALPLNLFTQLSRDNTNGNLWLQIIFYIYTI